MRTLNPDALAEARDRHRPKLQTLPVAGVALLADDVLGVGREVHGLDPYLAAFRDIDSDPHQYLAAVRDVAGSSAQCN